MSENFRANVLKSRVAYQLTCASCGARYIGETNRHVTHALMSISFGTKISSFNISVLLKVVGISVIFLVLRIPDYASTHSQLKIKESFHIEQLKPELSKQVECDVSLSLHF